METKKDISYLGKDFNQFRKNLIDFSRQYFPQTYTDFSPASPGMLFIEMAAYVGEQHVREDCDGQIPSASDWIKILISGERPTWATRTQRLQFED